MNVRPDLTISLGRHRSATGLLQGGYSQQFEFGTHVRLASRVTGKQHDCLLGRQISLNSAVSLKQSAGL